MAIDNNTDGEVDDYTADIISATDYYPFGMIMPGRNGYRGQGGWVSQAGSAGPDRGYTASIDLNNPRTTTQPSEYVAAGSIQMNLDLKVPLPMTLSRISMTVVAELAVAAVPVTDQ